MPAADAKPKRALYFINEKVEDLLRRYIWTGCTDVKLRDAVMSHATELIKQIIRKQGLHTIYQGQEESSFNDLVDVAWCQVERVLYKFRARPHCRVCYNPDRPNDSVIYEPGELEYGVIDYEGLRRLGIRKCKKCNTVFQPLPEVPAAQDMYGGSTTVLFRGNSKVFNMWSQIARTVILAHIKKDGRDRKNAGAYRSHILTRYRPPSDLLTKFLEEARELLKHNEDNLKILDALEHLFQVDDKPYDGLIGKLVEHSGLPRLAVASFMKTIRLRSFDFSTSPISRSEDSVHQDRRTHYANRDDD